MRPRLTNTLLEFLTPWEITLALPQILLGDWKPATEKNRKVILLIPGFMTGDYSLLGLTTFCRWLGHDVVLSGIKSNSDCPRKTLDSLIKTLKVANIKYQKRVVVIGQSLGGFYARLLAINVPDKIEHVITLGSPIKDLKETTIFSLTMAADLITAIRGLGPRCLTESCPCGVPAELNLKPPDVPITAVYSHLDGIVHWKSCIDPDPQTNNCEVDASHLGMGINYDTYRIVADRLTLGPR